MRSISRRALLLGLALTATAAPGARAGFFSQTDLVSDAPIPGVTTKIDTNLKNPWGVSNPPGGPFWVSNPGSNTSTLYDGQGNKIPLTVSVAGGPTGQIFNGTSTDFHLSTGAAAGISAAFVFDTLSGGIYAWNGKAGTTAEAEVTGTKAVYTGLATASSASGGLLFAADVAGNKIDVYDNAFHNISAAVGSSYFGKFVDPTLPAGYSVFNVNNINGTLFATYASNTNGGGSFIDTFDTAGNFKGRFAGNGPGGPLQGAWSVVLAPSGFGQFGGDLLVSNNDAGFGTIAAYDPNTHAYLGLLSDSNGQPIVNDGIWSLTFGNGARNSDPNTLYVLAGIRGEQGGLLAAINAVPEPTSALMVALGGGLAFVVARRRRARG